MNRISNKIFILPIVAMFFVMCTNPAEHNTSTANDIKKAIGQGSEFLKKLQTPDGAIADSTNKLFSIWETVLASQALITAYSGKANPTVIKSIEYLKNNENGEGLVCHNQKCKEGFCTETSAIYLELLGNIYGAEKIKDRAITLANRQQKTGEWLIGNPDVQQNKDFPSATAFALNILQKASVKPPNEDLAIKWLLGKQNKEGHWGNTWEYYDLPAYTLWQVMQLNYPELKEAKAKAIEYVLNLQKEEGFWHFKGSQYAKRPSKQLETALMLSVILNYQTNEKIPDDKLETAKQNAINYLISSQNPDGSWDGGFFPIDSPRYEKKEYVFATSLAIITLKGFLNQSLSK